MAAPANPFGFEWQQTMFRVKDPKLSVPFYRDRFGFQLLHELHFNDWGFSLYFMGILPSAEAVAAWPTPGTPAAGKALFSSVGLVTLELTWNHGTEKQDDYQTNNGNDGPHRGFSSIAVASKDVAALSAELQAAGVRVFNGNAGGEPFLMGRTFAADPDGYWIELVQQPADSVTALKLVLGKTTMRVKSAIASKHFYHDLCAMAVGGACEYVQLPAGTPVPANAASLFETRLELVECDAASGFPNHNGSDDDAGQIRGWGHIGFLVDDLHAACKHLREHGVQFYMEPDEGMKGIAFVLDPDNYQIEIIQKGL